MGMLDLPRIRREAFRLRGGLWTLLFLAILVKARPSLETLAWGMIPLLGGQLLRFWAAGTIGFYRGERVGALRLVTWGPYAFVRNPLYLGNGLIGFGWAWASGSLPAVGLFLLAFGILYGVLIVPHEEGFLQERFGTAYTAYCARTPALIPWKMPPQGWWGSFDASVLWRSERHSLWVTLAGTGVLVSRIWW